MVLLSRLGEREGERGVSKTRTSVEVDQWLNGNLCLNIALLLCLLQLLNLRVVGCHVGVVVLGVVQLHDLARDGWLECAIVVCYNISSAPSSHCYVFVCLVEE